jgi:hypothetical protein
VVDVIPELIQVEVPDPLALPIDVDVLGEVKGTQ